MTNKLAIGLVAASTLVLSGAIGARAADLPGVPVVPPELAASHDWSGAYIGLQAGYGAGDVDGTWGGELEELLDGDVVPFDLGGGFLGGQVGYNVQYDSLVLGIEGSLAIANIEGSGTQFDDLGVLVDATLTTKWLGIVAGKLGFAVGDSLLLYGTAGIAVAGVDLDVVSTGDLELEATDSQTHVGGVIGVGAEFAIDDNWSLGLDYKYADLGEQDYEDPEAIDGSATVGVTESLFSVRLNYKF